MVGPCEIMASEPVMGEETGELSDFNNYDNEHLE